jgi:hypothetical protein
MNPEVVTSFIQWVDSLYGDDEMGRVKAVRGKKHEYLGMVLDFSEQGVVTIDMNRYVRSMIAEYPYELTGNAKSPANHNLFRIINSRRLSDEKKKIFHTFVAKALFACKRARPDLIPVISFLSSRVREPNAVDQGKLHRMMQYLKDHPEDNLRLEGGNVIVTGADAAFAVHDDCRSQSGITVSLGKGAFRSESSRQKLNTRSSTEAELVAADEAMTSVLWTKWFCEAQGYEVKSNVLLQDNQAAIKLENNGKFSSHKRTRHINIRYFFITDQIEKKNVKVRYCPTDELMADFMTKPLQGEKFQRFKSMVMNIPLAQENDDRVEKMSQVKTGMRENTVSSRATSRIRSSVPRVRRQ